MPITPQTSAVNIYIQRKDGAHYAHPPTRLWKNLERNGTVLQPHPRV